ncbi:hypothetical protein SAMN02910298_02773 [Pseudobutyrivibrio sp. YE44]|uniref:hypothetical protein n=1 Tax=Pseudobutyrivibrio sp. YE44 TaxID=1520802 RepID=UPI0008915FE1|nr:hypothetical protein [Pseudobutyrivibrio sp. YE44]SDB54247.1 hypothetical protein SAMN02910298_02773 [Pseudobutyrivibrio sp. YE44]
MLTLFKNGSLTGYSNEEIEKRKIKSILKREGYTFNRNFIDIEADSVFDLITHSDDKYFIFIDNNVELKWEFTKNFEKVLDKNDWCKIQAEVIRIINLREFTILNKKARKQALSMLGTAIATVECYEEARKILLDTEVYVRESAKETVRNWLLIFTLGNIGILIACVVCNYFFNVWTNMINVLTPCFFGVLGGCFSILVKSRKNVLEYNIGAGIGVIFVDFLVRITISGLAAYILFLAFDAGIISISIDGDISRNSLRIILYITAGFSERLVPSLLERLEKVFEKVKIGSSH